MNYLAHLLLAPDEPEVRVGSVLADFTHVPNGRLRATYGEAIARGVVAHRRIDTFTDNHPSVMKAVSVLFPRHRHAGRIVIDIAFDYFLSRHWERFCDEPRAAFIERCHDVLRGVDENDERLPERFRLFARRFVEHDVLPSYHTLDGLGLALERVSKRIACPNTVRDALPDVKEHRDVLEGCFLRFFPDVRAYAGPAHEESVD